MHTLVEFVGAEDIANGKIRTHDLTLKVNNITNKLQSQTIEQQPVQLMFTQSKYPSNKTKHAYKKHCSHCHRTNRSIPSCFKKHRHDDDISPMRDQSLYKNLLYHLSVPTLKTDHTELITEPTTFTTDNVGEVHHETAIITKITSHRPDIALHHEIKITRTEVLLLNITVVHDMIMIKETLDGIVLLIDHTDHLTDASLDRDTDHIPIQEITILQDIFLHLDLLQDQKILDFLDPAFTLAPETILIQYILDHKMTIFKMKFEVHMYHPTEMANVSTPTSWLYSLY